MATRADGLPELSDFEVLRDAILAIHETVLTIDEDT